MQYRITKPSNLLDKHGELIQKGYATSPLLKYQREDVAFKSRLKEWDYYLINNDKYAVALTLAKSNALIMISASLIDLVNKKETTKTTIGIVSDKTFSMPESSETGDIFFQNDTTELSLVHEIATRKLFLFMKNFLKNENLEISLQLTHEPKDSMVIATPFNEGNKLFYYNQKIIGMHAKGNVKIGRRNYPFLAGNSYGLLDWGRGVWPYHTSWYWSAAQGMVSGNEFGFNLGYGFGDTSKATENMLFFNGVASKLEDVTFHIPRKSNNEYDYLKPWNITSSDGRIEMEFLPILDRSTSLSILVLSTNQHQVFGKFSGTAILDDGTIVCLNDFLGFAERVENRW